MSWQPVDTDVCWKVYINWTRPVCYNRIVHDGWCAHDDGAHLYHILGRYSTHPYRSLYIGKTYDQSVSTRIAQHHYEQLVDEHPRYTLFVSCGIVTIANGRRTTRRISDIETILIRTNGSEHAYNMRNTASHCITDSYHIHNGGYRCGLARELHLGFFARQ